MRILLTASGAQGTYEIIDKFHDHDHYVHAVDLNPRVIGRFVADRFSTVPAAVTPQYIERLIDIVKSDKIDVIYPQSDLDVIPLARNKHRIPCKVVVSSLESLQVAIDKQKTYKALRDLTLIPHYTYARRPGNLITGAVQLGYYDDEPIVCRLPMSKGGRGLFVITRTGIEVFNGHDSVPHYNLEDAVKHMKTVNSPVLMTEWVSGEEIDSMAVCEDGEVYLTTHKTRNRELAGTIVEGVMVKRPRLDKKIKEILSRIPLSYNISLQFKGGKLLEINPRSSTYIYTDKFSEPLLGLNLAMGVLGPDQVRAYKKHIPYGRKFIRYMRQHYW